MCPFVDFVSGCVDMCGLVSVGVRAPRVVVGLCLLCVRVLCECAYQVATNTHTIIIQTQSRKSTLDLLATLKCLLR